MFNLLGKSPEAIFFILDKLFGIKQLLIPPHPLMGLKISDLDPIQKGVFDKVVKKISEFINGEYSIVLEEEEAILHFLILGEFNYENTINLIREAWDLLWEYTNKFKNTENFEVLHSEKYLPFGQCGFSKKGAYVWYIRTGCCDVKGIWKSVGGEGIFNYPFQVWEEQFLKYKSEFLARATEGNRRYRAIIIVDLEGFPLWTLSKYKYFKFANDLKNQYFDVIKKFLPPTTEPFIDSVFVINNWTIFKPLIEFGKILFPYGYYWNKVQFLGEQKEYLPALLEKIDSDQIPPHWGGTMECNDDVCSEKICPGGKVPKEFYLKNRKMENKLEK